MLIIPSHCSLGVTIGFLETSYAVSEDDGNAQLMIGIISGVLETDIVVSISTANDTALCKFTALLNLTFYGHLKNHTSLNQ